MYGILGDIIGEPFEFDRGAKTKHFPLFSKHPRFTDDSVMTIAVCDVIRTAVSLGGDCDTLTDIAAALAEAFYGIDEQFKAWRMELTTEDMHKVMTRFDEMKKERTV